MKIFIIAEQQAGAAAYLGEILTAFGLCFYEACSLQTALAQAEPGKDVVVLPADTGTHGIEAFLQRGGQVLAILPEPSLEELAGLKRVSEQDSPSRLRFVQPVCRGTRGEAVWTQGAVRSYEVHNPEALSEAIAYSFHAADPTPDSIGIAEFKIGAGRLIVYAYDLVQCIVRLRQGHPERANFLPPGQLTPRAAFLQLPNPPADTFWRPTADLHALAFCGIVQRSLQRGAPVPLLWHLPNGAPSIVLFSGDEDAAQLSEDEGEMSDIETFGAAMNLYIFPGNTPLSKNEIEKFEQRGHTVSVHPYLSDTAGQPPEAQIAEAESQVRLFQERFERPVHTVRNHSYMWPGYLEIPDLWEKLGIGMDCNSTSVMRGDSPEWGPFAKLNAAMPLKFLREDGSLVDVYQQPTHINDDQMSHPSSPKSHKYSLGEVDAMLERLFDDAVRIDHSPICANFHPSNYALFSAEPARALLARARDLRLPICSVDSWHNFWRSRASWRMHGLEWGGSNLQVSLSGLACEGLTLLLPAAIAGQKLTRVTLSGEPVDFSLVQRRGQLAANCVLVAPLTEAVVAAEYSHDEGDAS